MEGTSALAYTLKRLCATHTLAMVRSHINSKSNSCHATTAWGPFITPPGRQSSPTPFHFCVSSPWLNCFFHLFLMNKPGLRYMKRQTESRQENNPSSHHVVARCAAGALSTMATSLERFKKGSTCVVVLNIWKYYIMCPDI